MPLVSWLHTRKPIKFKTIDSKRMLGIIFFQHRFYRKIREKATSFLSDDRKMKTISNIIYQHVCKCQDFIREEVSNKNGDANTRRKIMIYTRYNIWSLYCERRFISKYLSMNIHLSLCRHVFSSLVSVLLTSLSNRH